jgi:hypothetical protein
MSSQPPPFDDLRGYAQPPPFDASGGWEDISTPSQPAQQYGAYPEPRYYINTATPQWTRPFPHVQQPVPRNFVGYANATYAQPTLLPYAENYASHVSSSIPSNVVHPPFQQPPLNNMTVKATNSPKGRKSRKRKGEAQSQPTRPPKRAAIGPLPAVHGVGPVHRPDSPTREASPLPPLFDRPDGQLKASDREASDVWYCMIPAPSKEQPVGWTKPANDEPSRSKLQSAYMICRFCWHVSLFFPFSSYTFLHKPYRDLSPDHAKIYHSWKCRDGQVSRKLCSVSLQRLSCLSRRPRQFATTCASSTNVHGRQ